jgi:hypothetical protein
MMWTVHAIAYTSLLGMAAGTNCSEFMGCPLYVPEAEEIDDCIPEGDRRLRAGTASHIRANGKPRRLHPHPPEYAYVEDYENIDGNSSDVCCEEYRWVVHCGLHCWATTLRETTDEISFTEHVGVPIRLPGGDEIVPNPDSLVDAAKEECIAKGSACWGVMDMGCGGDPVYLCSAKTEEDGLAASEAMGTCTFQKVNQDYTGPLVGHAAPRHLGSYVLILLTLWALGSAVSHA